MTYKALIVLASALPLAACAVTNSDVDSGSAPIEMSCSADSVQNLVGQKVTDTTGADVLNAARARTLRWGPPRSAWTMDYRTDRVNVSYDDAMIITQISCG